MDGISLVNTGLAAAALTAAARILEALIKKSSLFKSRVDIRVEDHTLVTRLRVIEGRLKDMDDQTVFNDVLYRVRQLEIAARRHGWDVSTQIQGGGNG